MAYFFTRRTPILVLAAPVVGGALLLAGDWLLRPPMDYVVVAEFRQLPDDDSQLNAWLRRQPGVYIVSVHRNQNELVAIWGHSGNSLRDPVTPALRQQFEDFGYRGMFRYEERKSYRDK